MSKLSDTIEKFRQTMNIIKDAQHHTVLLDSPPPRMCVQGNAIKKRGMVEHVRAQITKGAVEYKKQPVPSVDMQSVDMQSVDVKKSRAKKSKLAKLVRGKTICDFSR